MKKGLIFGVVVISLLMSGMVFGQINFNGIGGGVGLVMPEDPIDSNIGFCARADLGKISTFDFVGEILYWAKSYGDEGFDWKWSQLYFNAFIKYMLGDENASMKPYVGGGLGLIIGTWSSDNEFFGDDSGSDTDIGITFLGGINFVLSPGVTGFAEARYCLGGIDIFGIFGGAIFALNK